RCDVQQTVQAPGALNNTRETQILMPADGRLSGISVQPGDAVAAGQLLASLDDHAKAQARIAWNQAAEDFVRAGNRLRYLQNSTDPVPADRILDAENDLALKQAEYDEAQATLDQMDLSAPFSGVVTEVSAANDHVFHPGDVLFKIIDPNALDLRANVTQEDY